MGFYGKKRLMNLKLGRLSDPKIWGSVIVSISWIVQNWIYADLSSRRSKFQYDMSSISQQMGVVSPWLILFNVERKKTSPDPEIIWNASKKFVQSVRSILEVAEQYYSPRVVDKFLTSGKTEKILTDLVRAKNEKRTEDIVALTMLVAIAFPDVDRRTRNIMQNHYSEIVDWESFWKNVFLVCYVVGSLAVLVGAVRVNGRTNK